MGKIDFQLDFIPQKAFAPKEQVIYNNFCKMKQGTGLSWTTHWPCRRNVLLFPSYDGEKREGSCSVRQGLLKNHIRSRHPKIIKTIRRRQFHNRHSRRTNECSSRRPLRPGKFVPAVPLGSCLSIVRSIPCQPGKPCNHRNWTDGPWMAEDIARSLQCLLVI